MINAGSAVSEDQLQYGDLLFTHAGHVGIYVGGGQIVHSPHSGASVHVAAYSGFYAARRL
jgi:cell wall-associated NlpC family hydrolase